MRGSCTRESLRNEEELKARKKYEEKAGIAEPAKVTGYVQMKALEKA